MSRVRQHCGMKDKINLGHRNFPTKWVEIWPRRPKALTQQKLSIIVNNKTLLQYYNNPLLKTCNNIMSISDVKLCLFFEKKTPKI
jgi:5-keto 4-deoxyuronate isomerase